MRRHSVAGDKTQYLRRCFGAACDKADQDDSGD
jgi:hypothetical protein